MSQPFASRHVVSSSPLLFRHLLPSPCSSLSLSLFWSLSFLSLWFGWRLGWRGGIRFVRLESLLAWLERERLATLTSTPISHSRYSDATKLRSEKARRATEGNRLRLSGADRVPEETVTRHTSCSKSSRHCPFIYSSISVDKCANDAEHHLRADALQPGTAAKVSSFFFLFASLTLTRERDLVFFAPARPPAGRDSIRSTRIPSCLAGA
jgi:hypothetical protein